VLFRSLDNLEMGLALLCQPWLAGDGIRRADLEREVLRLAGDLPLGPIYFQRVKRAVARLEELGVLHGPGEGRARRFLLAPEGFAAFLLNLEVLTADPTLDGTEFELKRSLLALWSLAFERLGGVEAAAEEVEGPPGMEEFLAAAERVRVCGEPVVTDERLAQALDVLRLVTIQREQIERRLAELGVPAEGSAPGLSGREGGRARRLDPRALSSSGLREAAALVEAAPEAAAEVRGLALDELPRLGRQAAALRYRQYLVYLDGLAELHAGALRRARAPMAPRAGARSEGESDG
jgi:hypothetical protein